MDDKITLDYEVYNEVYKGLKCYHRQWVRHAESFSNEKAKARAKARADKIKDLLDALAAADTYCE